ncbi:hypothetical protein N7462_003937 [Penicillium macrosclerotiorum]|uniref:uncharacterized protein n=1 Tax=Penicillium macrosclerotiorum TaxID=303699 RepID=UPI002548DED5|nr:uncharacterized protein N7462_003937 [Penicillium macrosclerotiorum]KAJ5689545.1 hypothetical protein N7462_003937 [Penicillium macrosclerotiorum]
MSLKSIAQELSNALCNRGRKQAFIPRVRVQEIWAGNRLGDFANELRLGLTDEQIRIAQTELLHTISLLIAINWREWSRFKAIFFPSDQAIANSRRDCNIASLRLEDLEHESFLGRADNMAHFFMTERWLYFPILLKMGHNDAYGEDYRLPLILDETQKPKEGGFGIVTKAVIPRGQIIIDRNDDLGFREFQPHMRELVVARKRFHSTGFLREVNQLQRLRSSSTIHKRIVQALSIVTIGNELNIISQWADMDLEEFIAGRHCEMPSDLTLVGLIGESKEIAGAIAFLHDGLQSDSETEQLLPSSLCHLDLKPRNILVFKHPDKPSTGKWAITDFGISRVAPRIARHYGSYQGPDSVVRPKNDIWSLGCILVRVFSLGFSPEELNRLDNLRGMGPDGVTPHNDDRFLRQVAGSPPFLNPHVKSWIDDLPNTFTSFELNLREGMKDLLLKMLVISIDMRLNAKEVWSKLQALESRARRPSAEVLPPSPPETDTPSTGSTRVPNPGELQLVYFALDSAIEKNRLDQVEQALKSLPADFEMTESGDRPLINAIKQSNHEIVNVLLEHGPTLNLERPSSDGETPLSLASRIGNVEIVKTLLSYKALPNSCSTRQGERAPSLTPLMEAVIHGHIDVISVLLEEKAKCEIFTGPERWNCLHYAVNNITHGVDLITAFKDKMDFNLRPPDLPEEQISYTTPLMLHISYFDRYPEQSKRRWREKFDALIDCGADVNKRYTRKSPLEIAIEKNNVRLARILVDADATLPSGYYKGRSLSSEMKKIAKDAKEEDTPKRGSADLPTPRRTSTSILSRFSKSR